MNAISEAQAVARLTSQIASSPPRKKNQISQVPFDSPSIRLRSLISIRRFLREGFSFPIVGLGLLDPLSERQPSCLNCPELPLWVVLSKRVVLNAPAVAVSSGEVSSKFLAPHLTTLFLLEGNVISNLTSLII